MMKNWTLSLAAAGFALTLPALEITHGPWLLNPDIGKISIGTSTDQPGGCGVEFRKAGSESWQRVWNTAGGQIRINRTMHVVHLDGLEPGAEYEYRMLLFDPRGSRKAETAGEPRTFRVSGKDQQANTLLICSDLQFPIPRRTEAIANLFKLPGAAEADCLFLLGDVGQDMPDFEREYLQGIIDPFVKIAGADRRPFVTVRGNHEWRGDAAGDFVDGIEHPGGNTYYTFRQGPDLFIVLDSGEDRPDRSPGSDFTDFNYSEPFFRAQRSWLEEVVSSKEFAEARYRIVLTHCGSYAMGEGYMPEQFRKLTDGLFDGTAPENRIHLMLAGHDHLYLRGIPGENRLVSFRAGTGFDAYPRKSGKTFPYVLAANDGPGYGGVEASAGVVTLTPEHIEVKFFTENGEAMDHFTVGRDGKSATLMKVEFHELQ